MYCKETTDKTTKFNNMKKSDYYDKYIFVSDSTRTKRVFVVTTIAYEVVDRQVRVTNKWFTVTDKIEQISSSCVGIRGSYEFRYDTPSKAADKVNRLLDEKVLDYKQLKQGIDFIVNAIQGSVNREAYKEDMKLLKNDLYAVFNKWGITVNIEDCDGECCNSYNMTFDYKIGKNSFETDLANVLVDAV